MSRQGSTLIAAIVVAGCAAHDPAHHAAHDAGRATPPAHAHHHAHHGQQNTPPMSELLAASPAADWRRLDPANTLYMEIASGRVIIELAPEFAPKHVANIRTLVRQKYYDGIAIVRSHDNYVVQWADPTDKRDLGAASKNVEGEFTRPAAGLAFMTLPDPDTYGEAGFASGFWAARESATGRAWMVHCYSSVGVGRGNATNSGSGASLYAVIGSAPRLLDRNITVVGRVVHGIEKLSVLPRGTGTLGFYEKPEQHTPIATVRLAADVPPADRTELEALRADSETFRQMVENRRHRRDDWYKEPAGHVDVCNVPLPIRNARPQGG
jgi:peptidylprolyl isomerase